MTNSDTSHNIEDCWNRIGIWRKGSDICSKLEKEIHCHNCDIYKKAGLELLDRKLPDNYKQNNTLAFSVKKENTKTKSESLLVFSSLTEWYALDTAVLDEICAYQPVHRIPHNPCSFIAGLVNIRGEIEACLSLTNLFNLKSQDIPKTVSKLIVIQLEAGRFAIPADEISGIFKFDTADILPPPVSVTINKESMINGIIEHNNHQAGVFNITGLEKKLARI